MFGKNHKSCSKKSLGTYKATLYDFVKAYTKQAENDAAANGSGFEASEDAIDLLQCQGNYYDDNGGYVRICNLVMEVLIVDVHPTDFYLLFVNYNYFKHTSGLP